MTATTTPAQSGEHGNQGPAITQGVTGTTGVETGTVLEGIRHKVFLDRYARKGEDGTPLEQYPEQMWRRVAAGIAEVEPTPEKRAEWTEKFAGLLSDFKFVPGGRILSGAGTGHQVTYYNCYVVGLGEDPLDPAAPRRPQLSPAAARPAFFNALTQMTDIMSRSGGVGMNLSSLPPRGTAIAQAGRARVGAVRPTVALDLRHPDVVRLLDEKDGPNLAHLDVAVIVPSDFDKALADDADWTLQWEDRRGDTLKARDLWARVTSDASAEAGRSVGILRPDVETLRIADSRDAIVAGAAEVAARLYRGEGVIVDFSPLRPKGAYIKTVNGTSSGPVAWMYLIDAVAQLDDGASAGENGVIWFGEIASTITGKTIQQGGSRRGALMLMLDDDHPDIEEFIKAKRIDPVTNRPVMIEHANMSVCASDAFMAAVKADLPWDLKWQGKVVRTVRARHLWDLICTAAWTTAEPGLVFMERAQREANTWYYENIRCVNPCVTGDTLVYTAGGLYPAAELAETGAPITVTSAGQDGVSFKQASHVFPTGVKPVYRLQTKEGYTVRLTADHKVLTTEGWREAGHLALGHKIRLLNGEGGFGVNGSLEHGRILGWLVGDGYINNRKGQASAVLCFWGEGRAQAEQAAGYVNQLVAHTETTRRYPVGVTEVDARDESRVESIRLMRLLDPELIADKLQVPPSVFRGSRDMQLGFLQALFTSDGTVNISGHAHAPTISIRLASSNQSLLTQVQQLLLNFGIVCRLYKRRDEGAKVLPNGKGGTASYKTSAQFELILGKENFVAFAHEIGFLQESKQRKVEDILRQHPGERRREYFAATFESLTPDGEEMVYDLTEPEGHLFVGNGILLHNCGEQPLPAGGVCNLGALNLERYVDANGALLEDDLARDAAYATRFLDNVIDATPYFSELHVAMQREGTRRTGLGTMGLADALIKMEVAYGSAESEEAIDRIYRVIRDSSYRASVELAGEKGAFGKFDRDKYLQGWFIRRLPEDVRDGIAEHGIRNGVLLTQAPTGCLVPGTMILTEQGYLPIETLGNPSGEQWQDIALRVASEGGVRAADKFFVNGKAHTTRVMTRRGYEIQGTDHHRVRVWQNGVMEWVSLDQVEPGMTVPIQAPVLIGEPRTVALAQPERCQIHGVQVSLPHALSPRLAYLIGYFMGDGSLKTRTLRFASSSVDDRKQICALLRDLFGREPVVYADPRAKSLTSIELHGQDVVAFWRANGFAKRAPSAAHTGKGYTPHVPLAILRSNDAAVYGGFLAGLFDADASLDREYVISWNTNEKGFHDQVKTMLLALGVFTHTYHVASEWSKRPLYRLRPCHAHASSLLNRALPMLARITPRESAARRLTLGDTIPVTRMQGRELALVGQTSQDKQAAYAATHLGYMTRDQMAHLVAAYHDTLDIGCTSPLVDAIDEPIFFDKVESVEDGGIHPTFDLSVPGTHAYVANGFVSHNTTSLLAGVSSGIEPVFDFAMKRVDRTGEHILYHPLYEAWRAAHPGEERPDFFVGAKDLTPEEHVVVQAKVQQYTDSSISKTANAPHDHTMEEVKRLYIQAYDLGCKGVTYYRDGSRDAVLTSVSEAPRKAEVADKAPDDGAVAPAVAPPALEAAAQPIGPTPAAAETIPLAPELVASPTAPAGPDLPSWLLDGTLKRRPAEMSGFTRNVSAPEGKVNITINSDADGPLELFINVGRAGSDVAALAEALGRLVSLQLRLPSTMSQEERLRQAANQLKGIGGSRSIGFGVNRVLSLPDAVAQAIYRHLEEHPAPPHKTADVPAAQLALPVAETSVAAPLAHPVPAPHAPVPAPAPAHVDNGNGNGHTSGHANGNGAGTQLSLGAAAPVAVASPVAVLTGNLCPQCGSSGAYVFEEGCKKCHYCGYSEC